MEAEKKIVIFCSSSYEIDPIYNQAAREFVRAACVRGYGIVSGGVVKGTMGEVADEAVKCGCWHKGVMPRFMEELVCTGLSERVWTDTMSVRKEMMREGTCAAVALPGGIGTIDELMETLVLVKLKQYDGKVLALNMNGFYDTLIAMLDHFVETKMLSAEDRELIKFPATVEELVGYLD